MQILGEKIVSNHSNKLLYVCCNLMSLYLLAFSKYLYSSPMYVDKEKKTSVVFTDLFSFLPALSCIQVR